MAESDVSTWLAGVLAGNSGAEADLVDRYAKRLLGLARRQLPEWVHKRFDPEDVVQSVYRSFFRRLQVGEFTFDDSLDVWRLLSAMTYRKTRNLVKFHQRQRRDVRRERPLDFEPEMAEGNDQTGNPLANGDLIVLFECLEQLLARLPDPGREIVMQRLEGQTIDQIAKNVRRSRRTVLRVLSRVQELGAHQLEAAR